MAEEFVNNQELPKNYKLRGRYVIIEVLGQGGFGITYLAEDTRSQDTSSPKRQLVAIKELFLKNGCTRTKDNKVMPNEYTSLDEYQRQRDKFYREAFTLLKFQNKPNIVKVLDIFAENNTCYAIMEYIEGTTLKDYADKKGRLPEKEIIQIGIKMLKALEIVHAEKMLHRDIKPNNIIIDSRSNEPMLIDFGTAREINDQHTVQLTISRHFSPPELYSHTQRQDVYSDLYSLGATLYYGLTCTLLPDANDRISVDSGSYYEGIIEAKLKSINISEHLQKVIQRSVNLSYQKRYNSAQDFLDDLLLEPSENQKPLSPYDSDTYYTSKFEETPIVPPVKPSDEEKPTPPRDRTSKPSSLYLISALLLVILGTTCYFFFTKITTAAPPSPKESPTGFITSQLDVGEAEITNQQYCTFLNWQMHEDKNITKDYVFEQWLEENIRCRIKWGEKKFEVLSNYENFPVNFVRLKGAKAYAKAVKMRLPSLEEFKAAYLAAFSGDPVKIESAAWLGSNANGSLHAVKERSIDAMKLYDLAGNVEEWTNDGYAVGGSIESPNAESADPRTASKLDPKTAKETLGFRCVK
jgi:serine/threonine protein kinase